MPIFIHCAI